MLALFFAPHMFTLTIRLALIMVWSFSMILAIICTALFWIYSSVLWMDWLWFVACRLYINFYRWHGTTFMTTVDDQLFTIYIQFFLLLCFSTIVIVIKLIFFRRYHHLDSFDLVFFANSSFMWLYSLLSTRSILFVRISALSTGMCYLNHENVVNFFTVLFHPLHMFPLNRWWSLTTLINSWYVFLDYLWRNDHCNYRSYDSQMQLDAFNDAHDNLWLLFDQALTI